MIELEAPEEDQNDNDFDDEETGGEWINEGNMHKHLAHGGAMVAIAPVNDGENQESTDAPEVAREEPENPDFPAFDENMLPSIAELDAK